MTDESPPPAIPHELADESATCKLVWVLLPAHGAVEQSFFQHQGHLPERSVRTALNTLCAHGLVLETTSNVDARRKLYESLKRRR